jgi:hypothetical protein
MSSASQRVRDYLDAMERRDLDRARAMLAPGFSMLFPGGVRLTTLEALVAWSRPRYQFVRKHYDRYDECPGDGETVVYCHGTLAGRWNDGSEFAGIRFIDRFVVRDGQLADQMVWNDMGEARAPSPG